MNAVWNSYGQLCGCPEIFKKSCKFFCRELDIRVSQVMEPKMRESCRFQNRSKVFGNIFRVHFYQMPFYPLEFIDHKIRIYHFAITRSSLWRFYYKASVVGAYH